MIIKSSRIFADYATVYLWDYQTIDKSIEDYVDDDIDFHLRLNHLGDDVVRFYTATNGTVTVDLETALTEPDLQPNEWDLVTETFLCCSCDKIIIAGATDYFPEAEVITLPAQLVRVRVCFGAMLSEPQQDHYRVQIWPSEEKTSRLLFQSLAFKNSPFCEG